MVRGAHPEDSEDLHQGWVRGDFRKGERKTEPC